MFHIQSARVYGSELPRFRAFLLRVCNWFFPVNYAYLVVSHTTHGDGKTAFVHTHLSPLHSRGRYHGIFNMAWSLSNFLGPLMGGLVLQRAGSRTLWMACGVVGLGLALSQWLIAPQRQRRMTALRATSNEGI